MDLKFSVITPCYNGQDYIAQTIESVLQQTYSNWEMIIVDDCSTDKSKEIILSYAQKDARIKYFSTPYPSGGPAVPRNIGIDNSQGDYICLLDSDDLWLKDKLQLQYDYIKQHNHHFICSDYEKISSEGERGNRIITAPKVCSYKDMLKVNTIACLTSCISRQMIGDKRFKNISNEDFEFWLQILKQGVKVYNIGQVTALYRESPNSRSSQKVKIVKSRWNILRHIEHIGLLPAFYYISIYVIKTSLKYLK